jgi:hypothetical protein
MEVAVTDRQVGDERGPVPEAELKACYEVIRNHMTSVERSRNVARITATLMDLYEDGWIDVEEAVVKAEYIESVLWETDLARRVYNAGF